MKRTKEEILKRAYEILTKSRFAYDSGEELKVMEGDDFYASG